MLFSMLSKYLQTDLKLVSLAGVINYDELYLLSEQGHQNAMYNMRKYGLSS